MSGKRQKWEQLERAIAMRQENVVNALLEELFDKAIRQAATRLDAVERERVLRALQRQGIGAVLEEMAEEGDILRTDDHPFWREFFDVLALHIDGLDDVSRLMLVTFDAWRHLLPAIKVAAKSLIEEGIWNKAPILQYLVAGCTRLWGHDLLLAELLLGATDWVIAFIVATQLTQILGSPESFWKVHPLTVEAIAHGMPGLLTVYRKRPVLVNTLNELADIIDEGGFGFTRSIPEA